MRKEKLQVFPSGGRDKAETAVKTIDRAARLLGALSTAGADGGMLTDLARQSALGKGTTHRLLSALIDIGFVFQDTTTRRYRLGVRLAELGRAAHQQDIGSLAQPFLSRIAAATGDTAYASVREGVAAVCVGREVGSFPIRTLSLDVGHRRPLGIGSGSLALFAFLPDAEIEQIIRKNELWLKNYPGFGRTDLLRLVAETRRYGFSFIDGRIIPGMNAIGVPVLDAARRPIAALSVAAIADRIKDKRVSELARLLQAEAANLGRALAAASRSDAPEPAAVPQRRRKA